MRVVRNPLNVMARLAEVVGGNGTTRRSRGRKWHVGRSPVSTARGLGTRLHSRLERVGSGGYRNTGWFSDGFGRFRPWHGLNESEGEGWSLRGFWREIGLREKENGEVIKSNDARGSLGRVEPPALGGLAVAWAINSEPWV
ncbi:hypothetical protein CRG98_016038 [Punica granatum]|uniref:Uncharacterized protein n=1 Tax=Punica granatum TaxID=22663 RepID=A0A2I0K4V0_PUNGR|nr:hypothetical protein CRG98_016038 [Punica granatum]